jgi:DNA repair protein RadC
MKYSYVKDMSLSELLACTLRRDAAERLLEAYGDLRSIDEASDDELMGITGMGRSSVQRLKAMFEIWRRYVAEPRGVDTISFPGDVAKLLGAEMSLLDREEFRAIHLNTRGKVIGMETISIGSLNASLVHPRELFKGAILRSAASLIAVHNHPSGDPAPSQEDIQLTKRLVSAGFIIGIELVDHIVLGANGAYISLKESGLM